MHDLVYIAIYASRLHFDASMYKSMFPSVLELLCIRLRMIAEQELKKTPLRTPRTLSLEVTSLLFQEVVVESPSGTKAGVVRTFEVAESDCFLSLLQDGILHSVPVTFKDYAEGSTLVKKVDEVTSTLVKKVEDE